MKENVFVLRFGDERRVVYWMSKCPECDDNLMSPQCATWTNGHVAISCSYVDDSEEEVQMTLVAAEVF